MHISPLSSNQHIRRYFSSYGTVTSFEPQIDKANGGALGIVFVRFATHEEAKRCVEKENGRKPGYGTGISCVEGESLAVVFDGEGKVLEAIMKELDTRRRAERERKHRKEKEEKAKEAGGSRGTPATNHSAGQTPIQPWRSNQHPPTQPRNAVHPPREPRAARLAAGSGKKVAQPPPALVKARLSILQPSSSTHSLPPRPNFPASGSSSSTPLTRGRRPWRIGDDDRDAQDSPAAVSRSPSPIARRPGQSGKSGKQREHEAVLTELSKNGFDHVTIDVEGGAVREDDVRQFFDGFKVDKVSATDCYPGYSLTAPSMISRFCKTIKAGTSLSKRPIPRDAQRQF